MNAEGSSTRGRLAGFAALLALLAFLLYARTGGHDFLNYDDPDYVTGNRAVAAGLTAEGAKWAFGFHAANWHPLTWLSHMLDVELFGMESGPMHLVNAGLHALNAALLFLALAALTRCGWPALVVAALFAAHPLRVQVVAWVSERKELLASTCFLALLLVYARHARRPSAKTHAVLFVLLALGCMAKPMLVTAPFVLLLLDVWPLRRLASGAEAPAGTRTGSLASLVLEKVPLFLAVAVASVLTVLAQREGGAIGELAALGITERVWTAGAGVLQYLRATVWPTGLAAFYPHPAISGGTLLVPGIAGLALVLVASAFAWRARACCGAVFTGWFWFLGMLVPVLGLVQVGDQAWADRYAYLPTIGLYVAVVYGVAESARAARLRPALGLAGLAAAGALALVTARILPHWRDSKSLFERALAVTEGNWIAHNNLGLVFLERREPARAREHFERAARLRPSFVQARYNLALSREAEGDFERAIPAYQDVLRDFPGHPETLVKLAMLARASGEADQAIAFFQQAIDANPTDARVYLAFARAVLELGDVDRAANAADSALKLDPSLAEAHLVLGEVAFKRRDVEKARERAERALALAPDSAEVHALLGRVRAAGGDPQGARAALERALQIDPSSARVRYDLGAILLGAGERELARAQFQAVNDIHPGDPQALVALAVMASEDGEPEQAIELYERALERRPGFTLALLNLAATHEAVGDFAKALESYDRSFAAAPPTPEAACAAAWILATGPGEDLVDGARAVELALYAVQRKAPNSLEVLAAAYARAGDVEKAIEVQLEAIGRAATGERKAELEQRLELYRAGKPYTRTR